MILYENNQYRIANPVMFDKLVNIVTCNKKAYGKLLKHSEHELGNWVNDSLPLLHDAVYKMSTKVNWILTGRTEFPVCRQCKKSQNYIGKNIKAHQEYSKWCCVKCAQQSAEVKEKAQQTNKLRYGKQYFTQTELYVTKTISTNLKNRGVEWACQDKNVIDKIEKSIYENLGVRHALQSKRSFQKFTSTCLNKYGVRNAGGSRIAHEKMHRKYVYNDTSFDSAPEIAFYIWLTDNNIKFKYQPDISFEYEFDGKTFFYFPDFLLEDENKLIEIKGDHFFKDGKMICPFRKKSWSDEKYEKICEKYEAKHQCMLSHDVQIYMHKDYDKFLQYVDDKYGKSYIASLRK